MGRIMAPKTSPSWSWDVSPPAAEGTLSRPQGGGDPGFPGSPASSPGPHQRETKRKWASKRRADSVLLAGRMEGGCGPGEGRSGSPWGPRGTSAAHSGVLGLLSPELSENQCERSSVTASVGRLPHPELGGRGREGGTGLIGTGGLTRQEMVGEPVRFRTGLCLRP